MHVVGVTEWFISWPDIWLLIASKAHIDGILSGLTMLKYEQTNPMHTVLFTVVKNYLHTHSLCVYLSGYY